MGFGDHVNKGPGVLISKIHFFVFDIEKSSSFQKIFLESKYIVPSLS